VLRELADLVLAPPGIFTLHIISHSLSLPMQARQVPVLVARPSAALRVQLTPGVEEAAWQSALAGAKIMPAADATGLVRGGSG
jgi:hypothetical protein